MFFDDHPEFLETSTTASDKDRLNLRHAAMIEQNADILRGNTVIDIASHDGRWTFAALEAGASHVTGIEGRQHLVDHTHTTLAAKGVGSDKYTLITGDVHERLHDPAVKGNVVMCLGFLYHTLRYVELFAGIQSTGADYVIIDSRVITNVKGPLVRVRTEGTRADALAIEDRYAQGKKVMSAIPSEDALVLLLEAIGYEVDHRTDWNAIASSHPDVEWIERYRSGQRVTFRAKRIGL